MKRFSKKILSLVLAVALVATISPVVGTSVASAAKKAAMSKKKATITVGKKVTLTAKNVTKVKKWTSSNKKVATVKKKGKKKAIVTGKKAGKATIKAKVVVKGKTKTIKCVVTVKASATPTPVPTGTVTPTPGEATPTPGEATPTPSGDNYFGLISADRNGETAIFTLNFSDEVKNDIADWDLSMIDVYMSQSREVTDSDFATARYLGTLASWVVGSDEASSGQQDFREGPNAGPEIPASAATASTSIYIKIGSWAAGAAKPATILDDNGKGMFFVFNEGAIVSADGSKVNAQQTLGVRGWPNTGRATDYIVSPAWDGEYTPATPTPTSTPVPGDPTPTPSSGGSDSYTISSVTYVNDPGITTIAFSGTVATNNIGDYDFTKVIIYESNSREANQETWDGNGYTQVGTLADYTTSSGNGHMNQQDFFKQLGTTTAVAADDRDTPVSSIAIKPGEWDTKLMKAVDNGKGLFIKFTAGWLTTTDGSELAADQCFGIRGWASGTAANVIELS